MKKIIASIAVLAAMAMAVPAMASEAPGHSLTVGGRIKADMGWQVLSDKSNRNNSDGTIANFFMAVNNNSYFRATFASADKTTGAVIELGIGSSINNDNNGMNALDNWTGLRQAYGWWKVGSCKLLVGQYASTLGAIYFPNSNLGHTKTYKSNLNGFGFIGGGTRNPKVGLQMAINDNFGFDVAIGQAGSESATSVASFSPAAPDNFNGSSNSYLPRLEVVLDFKFGNFMITPGAGIAYQQWKYDGSANAEGYDDSALSYLLWLPMQYTAGPFKIMLSSFFGQNQDTDWTGEWGLTNNWGKSVATSTRQSFQYGGQPGSLPMFDGQNVENTTSWGVGLAMDFAFTDQLTLSLGGGMVNSTNSAWEKLNSTGEFGNDDYTRWGAYISMPYKVSSNFTIAPEIAYYNYGDKVGYVEPGDEDSAGDEWLLGIHFQFLY